MTIKYRIIDWQFNAVKLAQEITYAVNFRGITIASVAAAADISHAAVKDLMSGKHHNPEIKTLLGVINALDLDVREYFQLES